MERPRPYGNGDGTATTTPAFPLPPGTATGPFAVPPAALSTMSTEQARRALALSWALSAETATGSRELTITGAEKVDKNARTWAAFIYNGT